METARLAAHQKKARRLNATLVFWDESGFLMVPIVRRTWAPKGQTPVLHHNAKRMRKVSAIGMLTLSPGRRRLGCYHLLQPDASIDETLIVAVLRQMRRHFQRPLIVLWDRLQAHRSHWVRNYLTAIPDVHVEYFPAYAPELNPVEYLWADTKTHDLAQFCPHDLDELTAAADTAMGNKPHDQHRLAGYLRKSGLPLRLKIKPQP